MIIPLLLMCLVLTIIIHLILKTVYKEKSEVLVLGGFFTDIIGSGLERMPELGEVSFGEKITFGPGGKSANIARMCATLNTSVAMVGITTKDPFGLWKLPITSLQESGVNTDHVVYTQNNDLPGIGLITVNKKGNNKIFGFPGANALLSKSEIQNAKPLFKEAKILAMALELPYETALFSLEYATKHHLKIFLDAGGLICRQSYTDLLSKHIFFLKPNEQEAEMLTGVKVIDEQTAKKAAKIMLKTGTIKHVLITVGKDGAYYFTKNVFKHYKVPTVQKTTQPNDAGCGDQTMAAIVSTYLKTHDIDKSIQIGLLCGTLQYYKSDISPVKPQDIRANLYK